MGYHDIAPRSPWIAQLRPDGPPAPLSGDTNTDVVIVGAGIAGLATAFFVLRNTPHRVTVLERDRVARGASGRNAGQLTTYFERPLYDIAAEFGVELACEAQRGFDDAHDLLDLLVTEAGLDVRVERFTGHMGMFNLSQLDVHLRNNAVRRDGGIERETIKVSQDAEFLGDIAREYRDLYEVVPQHEINELLGTVGTRYRAVLSDRKGCANSGMTVQQTLAHLQSTYADRLGYFDHTKVERVVVSDDEVVVEANGHRVTAGYVVMCTNGFADHVVEDRAGAAVRLAESQRVAGVVGYMAAFFEESLREPTAISYIRNDVIGGETPYVYVTRRTYDRPEGVATLTCMGGPERPLTESTYDPNQTYPASMLQLMDDVIRPYAQPARPAGLPFDFQWHGLMGYSPGMIRVIGAHPQFGRLLFNLGCNGVGFLPSVFGGERVSRLLAGKTLPPSIFDPR